MPEVYYCRRKYGSRKKHPLYGLWRRMKQHTPYAPEWEDIEVFGNDVGRQPPRTFLRRVDETKPIGPGNFHWKPRAAIKGQQ